MVDHARARRLAVRVQQVVAATLERQVKDPRLAMVTITDTRVTGDLREATVFYTVLGDDGERQATGMALESARGLVRTEVGRALGVRHTPSIAFVADVVPDRARDLDAVLEQARQRDLELEAVRAGKQPAGEADPYRKPRVVEDDDDEL